MIIMCKKEGVYYGIVDPVIVSAKIYNEILSKVVKKGNRETDSKYDTILQITIKGKYDDTKFNCLIEILEGGFDDIDQKTLYFYIERMIKSANKVLSEYKEKDALTKREFEELVSKYISTHKIENEKLVDNK